MTEATETTIDVRQWLSSNQLSDIHSIFTERQISIEELLEFDVTDIRQFADDIGLDTLQKNRLVKGIQKLKHSTKNTHAMHPNYCDETTQLMEELQASFKTVDESVERCKNEVNMSFDELFAKLKTQQTKILKDIDENGQNKKNEIGKQLQTLIDARVEMKQLQHKDIKQFKAMVSSTQHYTITYQYNKTAQNNLLASMHLKASGLPQGCLVIINDDAISSHSVKISWLIHSDSPVTQYEIQYSTNPKQKRIKKKKNKKRKYDSSYGSSSDSDSSSNDTESTDSADSDCGDRNDEKERSRIEMDDVDITQLEFESVIFENAEKIAKKKSYKLRKLDGGCCYVIRMRSGNELGWSEWSECVQVMTNSKNKWQFEENEWKWKDFDTWTTKKIQRAYDHGKKQCYFDIPRIGQSYSINFNSMQQRNVKTRKIRKVRMVR
eukprot:49677_1